MDSIFYGVHLNLGGAKLMVVDDSRTTRKAVVAILKRQGFELIEAANGEEAMATAIQEEPDLILMDVVMEGMDGFETCQRFKETPKINEIPIIFLTAQSEMKSILKGFAAGGSDYIVKPFNPIEALARISAHIQVRLLTKSQEQLIAALGKANDAKTKMIGVASHDLRGPLGSIKELTRLMTDGTIGDFDEEQKELVNTIHQSSDSMLDLVTNLLDVSMIESNEVSLRTEETQLEELLKNCVELQKVNAERKSINLEYVNHGIFGAVECDKRQMRRVIDNMISNALKYSESGTKAVLSSMRVGDQILIRMEDEGQGIPENEMHKLFKEYGTTSAKPTGNEVSTGLGLSICKKIIEKHQGSIRIENRRERGLRCQIEIPAKQFKNELGIEKEPESKREIQPSPKISPASCPDTSHNTQNRLSNKTAFQGASCQ